MPAGYVSIHHSQTSFSEDAILTTNYADNEITKGTAFPIHRRFDLNALQTVKFVLDLSLATDKTIFSLPLRMNTDLGQCFVDTYKIDTYVGGTIIPSTNRNALSANVALSVFKEGVTSTDVAGDDLRQYIVGSLSTNQFSGGGAGGGMNAKVLNGNPIIIEVANQENEAIVFELNLNWYEL